MNYERMMREIAKTNRLPYRFDPHLREIGGKIVRDAWIKWARTQPDPKESWLVPYKELNEADKEADKQIYDAVAHHIIAGIIAFTAPGYNWLADAEILDDDELDNDAPLTRRDVLRIIDQYARGAR